MKKVVAIGIVATLALSSFNVFAGKDGSNYVGIQYAISTYSEDGISEDLNPTALIGRLGTKISDNFSIEARAGIGLQDDTVNVSGIDATLDIDSLLGVYGIGHISVNESTSVYGLLGITRAEASVSLPDYPSFGSVSNDETGLSYGVGVDIGVSNDVALNIEYAQYLSKSDFDVSALSFGLKFGF